MMYHAQEKIINTPGSEMTGRRGGIHNSVTRATLKPTHMIGGYAQQSYGFNYYGTVGSNRDEFIIVRKMNKVDWLDELSPQPLTATAPGVALPPASMQSSDGERGIEQAGLGEKQ
jgi:nitrate reductase alpha subunit